MFKKLPYLFIAILSLSATCFSQTTIYSEDFTGQNGKGSIGPGNFVDVSGVTWNIDITGASLTDNRDYLQVRNEALIGRDLENLGIWLSPSINISGFTNVQFSLDLFDDNANDTNENSDFVTTEYRIDGGIWTFAATNSNLTNDFAPATATQTGLSGTTLEIRVTMRNDRGNERYGLDNILVEGTAPTTPNVNVTPTMISDLGYVEGDAPLAEEFFSVQGFALTNDIIINAPSNFLISTTSGTGFTNTITLNQIAGEVSPTTIFVKMIAGLTVNNYNQNVEITSVGASDQFVNLDGDVIAPIADCSELIISEYHEPSNGNGNNKYIELYNPTNAVIDLSDYRIANYRNGQTTFVFSNLSGSINPFTSFLISRTGAALAADLIIGGPVINFDGNDVVALQTNSGVNIDVIGIIGDNTIFARNVVLRRNQNISVPTVSYNASQWSVEPVDDSSNLGVHNSDCACPDSTTWNGSMWSNGLPDSTKSVILDGNYITASSNSFTACSLTVNSTFTLRVSNGDFIEVENFVLVNDNASLITETQGSFVQNGNAKFKVAPSGLAEVQKTTPVLNTEDDYVYWSSPTNNITIDDGLGEGNPGRRYTFNAFNFEDYLVNSTGTSGSDGLDDNNDAWTLVSATDIMEVGKGYISMHGLFAMGTGVGYQYTFPGAYNTGNISQTVPFDSMNTQGHWNLLGNPYPSSIDTNLFFSTNNTVVEEVIYMWSHVTPANGTNFGNEVLNFNQADYITVNTMGGSGTGANGSTPSSQIPSAQAFFIKSIAAGTVNFTNSMRNSGTNANDEFWRSANANTRERLWINLSSDIGIYSQILIAYDEGATDGFDGNGVDTFRNYAGNAGLLYSLDENDEGFYVIQGKALSGLNENEKVKLGFGAYISTNESYTLEAIKYEGNFLENNSIFIKDNYVGTTHDLTESAYTFTSDGGNFEDRFEIVFKNQALGVEDNVFNENNLLIVELEDDLVKFELTSQTVSIEALNIYDLQGRLIYSFKGNSHSEIFNLSNLSQQVYLVKAELSNGSVVSKKSIKK